MMKKIAGIPKWPVADEIEERMIKEVLDSGCWWRNAGTQVKAFEKEFAAYHGVKGAITVSNGTQALEIALKALGIRENDEVIVPDFTFYSTVSAVLAVKAIPVIVDVEEDTFNIDPEKIEVAITEKTKAIIAVHMAGNIADMKRINSIAEKYGLFVVEDAAHAHGAFCGEKAAGSFGTISTYSFQNTKLMSAGEGGIILSDDEALLHKVFLESNCGREEGDTTYRHVRIGTNARMSEVQGAILRGQLSRLKKQVELREENYSYFKACIEKVKGIRLQRINEDMAVNPHYMVMFYYDTEYFNGLERDVFVRKLKEVGIPCNRSFEAIHKLPIFKMLRSEQWRCCGKKSEEGETIFSNTEKVSTKVICLYHNILLGDKQLIRDVVDVIENIQKEAILK